MNSVRTQLCGLKVICTSFVNLRLKETDPDGAVVMSSANRLVGTGFASRYRLQPRAGFLRPNG